MPEARLTGQRKLPTSASEDWLTPIRKARTFEDIIQRLEAALLSGTVVVGERLPSERELALRLGVSRASVREAMRALEAFGLIDVQRGPAGITLRALSGNAFANILRMHLAVGQYPLRMIVELRACLEGWASRHLADAGTQGQLARIEEILTKMDDPSLAPEQLHELDAEFHAAIIDSTGNEFAKAILSGCRTVVRREMLTGMTAPGWPDGGVGIRRDHRQLFEAMRAGNGEDAQRLVTEHIWRWASYSLGDDEQSTISATPEAVIDATAPRSSPDGA